MATRQPTRRATTAAQKEARRVAILDAAEVQVRSVGIDQFSLEALAKYLGLARGTLYLSFATREEVLLGLYERHLAAFHARWSEKLAPGMSDETFVMSFLEAALADPLHLELTTRLELTLEHNLPEEKLLAWKTRAWQHVVETGELIAETLDIDPDDASQLAMMMSSLMIGAWLKSSGPSMRRFAIPAPMRSAMRSWSVDQLFVNGATAIVAGVRARSR